MKIKMYILPEQLKKLKEDGAAEACTIKNYGDEFEILLDIDEIDFENRYRTDKNLARHKMNDQCYNIMRSINQ